MYNQRIDWIDRWKGILIALVVAGHVAGGACHLCGGANSAAMSLLYKIIYTFHMPAFFFLAGLCWKGERDVGFFFRKARRLLVPYAIFGFCSAMVYLLMTNAGNLFAAATDGYYQGMGVKGVWQPFLSLLHGGGWPSGEGFRCNSVLWFLPAMFSCLGFYWIVNRVIRGRIAKCALAIGLLVFEFLNRRYGFIGALPFGLSYIPWYGAFIILGHVTQDLPSPIRPSPSPFASTFYPLSSILYPLSSPKPFSLFLFPFSFLIFLAPNAYYAYISPIWYLVFFIFALAGIWLSAGFARLCAWPWLARLGRTSLGIMLIHKFVILFLQVKLPVVAQLAVRSSLLFWIANILILVVSVAVSYWASLAILRLAPWAMGRRVEGK